MTKDDIWRTLLMVRQAYQDSLDGKSISFTGVNGRAIDGHDHNENGDGGGVTNPPNQKM